MRPERKWLRHELPSWIHPNEVTFFITICCQKRRHNHLCHKEMAAGLFETVENRVERDLWYPHVFLLMPDHLHALISFHPSGKGMTATIREWKSWTAKKQGIVWQRGFFDHRLRGDEGHTEKADYIRANPVRAGLVAHPDEWPYVWTPGK